MSFPRAKRDTSNMRPGPAYGRSSPAAPAAAAKAEDLSESIQVNALTSNRRQDHRAARKKGELLRSKLGLTKNGFDEMWRSLERREAARAAQRKSVDEDFIVAKEVAPATKPKPTKKRSKSTGSRALEMAPPPPPPDQPKTSLQLDLMKELQETTRQIEEANSQLLKINKLLYENKTVYPSDLLPVLRTGDALVLTESSEKLPTLKDSKNRRFVQNTAVRTQKLAETLRTVNDKLTTLQDKYVNDSSLQAITKGKKVKLPQLQKTSKYKNVNDVLLAKMDMWRKAASRQEAEKEEIVTKPAKETRNFPSNRTDTSPEEEEEEEDEEELLLKYDFKYNPSSVYSQTTRSDDEKNSLFYVSPASETVNETAYQDMLKTKERAGLYNWSVRPPTAYINEIYLGGETSSQEDLVASSRRADDDIDEDSLVATKSAGVDALLSPVDLESSINRSDFLRREFGLRPNDVGHKYATEPPNKAENGRRRKSVRFGREVSILSQSQEEEDDEEEETGYNVGEGESGRMTRQQDEMMKTFRSRTGGHLNRNITKLSIV